MTELRGEAIGKIYPGGVKALDAVSFSVSGGQVLTLLGPSGCGKSTLLRIVAGLEQATSGKLTLDGESWNELPPGRRDVGFVFQNYALYPHMTVRRNMALALEVRGASKQEIEQRVRHAADLLGIGALLDRRPGQLSGGQQQRVALGRALVRQPRLYLMDEPLSNLDALLRESTRTELKALFRRLGATVLYVTHDQAEAMSLSDRVLLLKDGQVRQCDRPSELYLRPADLFAATFIGSPRMTVWRATIDGDYVTTPGVRLARPRGIPAQGEVWVGIRPEDVELADQPANAAIEARVELVEPLGDRTLLTLALGAGQLRALTSAREIAETLWVHLPPDRLHWFDAGTERRLEVESGLGAQSQPCPAH